jgi:hypothetical protein
MNLGALLAIERIYPSHGIRYGTVGGSPVTACGLMPTIYHKINNILVNREIHIRYVVEAALGMASA